MKGEEREQASSFAVLFAPPPIVCAGTVSGVSRLTLVMGGENKIGPWRAFGEQQ